MRIHRRNLIRTSKTSEIDTQITAATIVNISASWESDIFIRKRAPWHVNSNNITKKKIRKLNLSFFCYYEKYNFGLNNLLLINLRNYYLTLARFFSIWESNGLRCGLDWRLGWSCRDFSHMVEKRQSLIVSYVSW